MVMVEHGGHAVEAEAVKNDIPPSRISGWTGEKMQYLILAVVEAAGVPGGVIALRACVEILIGVPSNSLRPSRVFFLEAWEWTTSSSTAIPGRGRR